MDDILLAVVLLAVADMVVIGLALVLRRKWWEAAKAVLRPDSLAYTTLAGVAIGCLLMCGFPHTIAHGAAAAFGRAGLLSAEAALLAGMVGRGSVAAAFGERHEATGRWVGNVLAFLTPLLTVPPLALA